MKNWDENEASSAEEPVVVVPEPTHEVDITVIGNITKVPDNPCSKLSYYLNCINGLGEPFTGLFNDVPELINYKSTYWTSKEREALIILAIKLDPEVLVRTGVLQVLEPTNPLLAGMSNTFIKVDVKTKQTIAIASEELIAIVGREKVTEITKIMACTNEWLKEHRKRPIKELLKPSAPAYRPPPPVQHEGDPFILHLCLCWCTNGLWCPIWLLFGRKPGQCCYYPCGCEDY